MIDAQHAADYRQYMDEPWGRMFYELMWAQLGVDGAQRLRVLDFGSGFGISAAHLAAWHDVTALEPASEMRRLRVQGDYRQVEGGASALPLMSGGFDLALCHNVLEYVDDQQAVIRALLGMLRPGGRLSVIKHNLPGKVMHAAVFQKDPVEALRLMETGHAYSYMMGAESMHVYTADALDAYVGDAARLDRRFGLRAAFALIEDNSVKYEKTWYDAQLELEKRMGSMEPYRSIAAFEHRIYVKTI